MEPNSQQSPYYQSDEQASAPPPSPPTQSSVMPPTPRKSHRGLWEVLVVLLLVGAAVGGYFYGNNKTTTVTKTVTAPQKANSESAAVHFVQSIGYPFDLGAKTQITTKLGLPSTMQGVATDDAAAISKLFTDKSNDVLATYNLGTPDNVNDAAGGGSELSLFAVSKSWLAANNTTADAQANYLDASALQTPAQKQKFVSDLKTAATACATDQAKGFATKDKALNICYELNPGKAAYSPSVILKGYGEIEKQPIVLAGLVNLYDPTTYTDQAAQQKVITDAKAGKLPTKTKTALDALVAALTQTTVTASPNPLKQ